jgi:transcriptional regulator with GAF, ATPase, and Fis domain
MEEPSSYMKSGDSNQNLQVMFLSVIQNKEINRVGSNEVIKEDKCIVAATHKDLKDLVKKTCLEKTCFTV